MKNQWNAAILFLRLIFMTTASPFHLWPCPDILMKSNWKSTFEIASISD
jgi:hypothetical protein